VHPTVDERFDLAEVTKCADAGPYRPQALCDHDKFKRYYVSPAP
jgi:hypothetical protein